MKMTQISDSTLKITISMTDLAERGMELSDFLLPQEKTEDFFYSVLEEVDLPDHFRLSGMLSFRVTPKKDKLDIFVTKSEFNPDFNMSDLSNLDDISQMSPEDFFKELEKGMREKGDKEALDLLEEAELADELMTDLAAEEEETNSDYVHFVLSLPTIEQVAYFAQAINYEVETAELYKYKGQYEVTILLYVVDQPADYADHIYARLLEHASPSHYTRAYLREHASLLLEGDFLSELAGARPHA